MAYAEIKRAVRVNVLRPLLRVRARLLWHHLSSAGLPIVFGNSTPKGGSHLLLQILQGIGQLGPFVDWGGGPVRTITIKGRMRSPEEILRDLGRLRPGDVAWGYLRSTPENIAAMCRSGWVNYIITRDPRDRLVSHIYYARDKYPGHAMHTYYNQLPDFSACLNVAIQGIHQDGLHLPSVGARYDYVMEWFQQPQVLEVRFEDLILNREPTIQVMLDHLEASAAYRIPLGRDEAIQRVLAAIDPLKSPTFRKGSVGDWREYFTPEHKRLFKEVTGDLLIQLGYEQDDDW